MEKLMILRLEGALQSGGEAAPWDNRGTASYPTKSGIVGLIACAMGLPREDPEILRLSRAISVGVRADRQGVPTCDFQTVQGMPRILNAAGKPRGNIVAHRWYLEDASFLVVIAADSHWLERIRQALENPVWCIYLGRKTCVPSRPVLEEITEKYETISQVLHCYPAGARADAILGFEAEEPMPEGSSLSRPDVPAGNREFDRRKVWRGTVRRDALCT